MSRYRYDWDTTLGTLCGMGEGNGATQPPQKHERVQNRRQILDVVQIVLQPAQNVMPRSVFFLLELRPTDDSRPDQKPVCMHGMKAFRRCANSDRSAWGPTSDISPRSTLKICGSRFHPERTKTPEPFVPVRNLQVLNGTPPSPRHRSPTRAGLPDLSRMTRAMIPMSGRSSGVTSSATKVEYIVCRVRFMRLGRKASERTSSEGRDSRAESLPLIRSKNARRPRSASR